MGSKGYGCIGRYRWGWGNRYGWEQGGWRSMGVKDMDVVADMEGGGAMDMGGDKNGRHGWQ